MSSTGSVIITAMSHSTPANQLPPARQGGGWAWLLIVLLVIGIAAGLTLVNYNFAMQSPGGNDFAMRWIETRLFLTEGLSPYSDAASLAAQELIHGHPAGPGEDQALFTYPVYAAIIFAPYSLVSEHYPVGRALWMTTLQLALLGLALISLRLADWKLPAWGTAAVFLFSLLWYHSLRPVINGNISILSALFIAGSLLAMRAERDSLAGILLSLATVKPQVVVLLAPLLVIWAFSHRRWAFIVAFIGSLVILTVGGSIVVPNWIGQNIAQVASYADYTPPGTPGSIFTLWWPAIGRWLGLALTIILAGVLVWRWRAAYGQDFAVLLPTAYLSLAITNLIGITTAASNFIALLPGVILVAAFVARRYQRWGNWLSAGLFVGLLVGLWLIFWLTLDGRYQSPILLFILPVFSLISLLWVSLAPQQAIAERPELA